MILKLHEALVNKDINSEELINDTLTRAHKLNEECHYAVSIIDSAKPSNNLDNYLSNIPFGVKDNYSTKGVLSTGSSNTLKNYIPIFDATAVKKLKDAGAVMIDKTVLDEFGMGGSGLTGHTGPVLNPWDKTRICGGSSAGSACAVASGLYPFALGSDTGDSIRKPAAYTGVVGYKPTYGMISRFGLFAFASSLDTCGVLASSVEDAAIAVDAMKGLDPRDLTTWDSSNINLFSNLNKSVIGKKLFYIKELVDINNYKNADDVLIKHLENFHNKVNDLRRTGLIIEEVSVDMDLLKNLGIVYTCISCAEATSNMSNLTGLSFGPRASGASHTEVIKNYRTIGFSPLIKRRFIIGSYVLQKENQEKYYLNALRVRRLVVDKFKNLFKSYDGLILPVASGIAPKIDEVSDKINTSDVNALDNHLVIANFGGFPSVTVPNGSINGMPVGINITCDNYEDELALELAKFLEKGVNYEI